MNTKLTIAIIVVGIFLVGGYLYYSTGAEVSATGISAIQVTPDEISVYISAEANGDTAQEAQSLQNAISDKLLTQLTVLGIDRKDIQTQSIQVYQDYRWENGQQTSKGFKASQQFIVKNKNFALTSQIVDSAINSGALVSGINFELSQELQNKYKSEALAQASKDGREKAEATANGLGKSLGRLVSVNSQDFGYRPWVYYANGGADSEMMVQKAATSIVPTSQDVSASVSVRYKIGLF